MRSSGGEAGRAAAVLVAACVAVAGGGAGVAPAAAAEPAAAAPGVPAAALLDIAVGPMAAQFGTPHTATGRMRAGDGSALAGRRVSVQVRPFPYTGRWRPVDHVTTNARGRFTVDHLALDRNADVRAVAFDGTTSGIARAFTYPAHRLDYKVLRRRRLRLTQSYRTPAGVHLRRRTLFYVGGRKAASAPVTATARTRRVAPGRFRSVVTVALPRSFHGGFRYGSCFRYTPGSGMGDPAEGCPKRYRF